jgi:hypothetical protein
VAIVSRQHGNAKMPRKSGRNCFRFTKPAEGKNDAPLVGSTVEQFRNVAGLGGLFDGLLGWLAARGRYRGAVLAAWNSIMVLYGVIGIGGVLGLALGQPLYVWVPLTTVGLCIAWINWRLRGVIKSALLQAELRRSVSRDL